MRNMDEWASKDDLDLTSDDIGQMIEIGQYVESSGPIQLPPSAVLVTAPRTYGVRPTLLPPPRGKVTSELRVSQPQLIPG